MIELVLAPSSVLWSPSWNPIFGGHLVLHCVSIISQSVIHHVAQRNGSSKTFLYIDWNLSLYWYYIHRQICRHICICLKVMWYGICKKSFGWKWQEENEMFHITRQSKVVSAPFSRGSIQGIASILPLLLTPSSPLSCHPFIPFSFHLSPLCWLHLQAKSLSFSLVVKVTLGVEV